MSIIGNAVFRITNKKPRRLIFSSANSFTLEIIGVVRWDGVIEYSTDGLIWTVWDGTSISSELFNGVHVIIMRGYGNTIITGEDAGTDSGAWHFTGTNISISGSITAVIDYKQMPTTIGDYAYKNMFGWKDPGNTAVVDASGLIIDGPITNYCCYGMFSRNKGMTAGPKLPSLTLATACYQSMFYQCEALNVLPRLRATVLPASCYSSLFNGCTNIQIYESSGVGHTTQYRIPLEGTGVDQGSGGTSALGGIFNSTGGDFTGNGTVNTTYYTSNLIADD